MPSKNKQFDLVERTATFAKKCRLLVSSLNPTTNNFEDGRQLIKSSGSVAANYIEANEAISRKDFFYRIKLSRKEAKESSLWLRLLDTKGDCTLNELRISLYKEGLELTKIFSTIALKDKALR